MCSYLDRTKQPLMSQERMELWSNDSLTEFAIKFNSIIEVTTSNDPETMTKIDECPYRLAMKSIGIIRFPNGLFTIWQTNLLFYLTPKPLYKKSSIFETIDDNEVYSSYTVSLAIKVKNKPPPKPGLKCHFCNLKYCLEEERKQHEEFWHSNKIKM